MSEIENVDEPEVSDVATAGSNVRKDLNEFQEKHATLVLTTVKVNSLLLSLFFFFSILNTFLYWIPYVGKLHCVLFVLLHVY